MTDSERAQLLKKLLARVRANADARPPPGSQALANEGVVLLERPEVLEHEEELKAWPAAGERTSFPEEVTEAESALIARRIDGVVPMRRSSRPPRGTEPLAIAERGVRSLLRADRWSELVEDDGPMASFASEVPLPPPPPTPSVEQKFREPEGALERAVQHAAREKAAERGAIWLDLVAELKERRGPPSRPTTPAIEIPSDLPPPADPDSALTIALSSVPEPAPEPEPQPEPAQAAPPEDDEATEGDLPLSRRITAPPVARSVSPEDSMRPYERHGTLRPEWSGSSSVPSDLRRTLPSSLLPPSRRARRRGQRWSYAKRLVASRSGRLSAPSRALAFVAAVGIVAAVIAVAWFRSPSHAASTAPVVRVEPLSTPSPVVATTESPRGTTATSTATSAGTSAPSSAPSAPTGPTLVGITAEEGAPADTAALPETLGYLLVASSTRMPVYLNGTIAGDTGSWMKVGCGWRYLRLARHGSPPAGSSFPVWATEGRSVLVPCRGATRVELSEDR